MIKENIGMRMGGMEPEISVAEYLKVIYHRRYFILILTILIAAATAVKSMLIAPTYEATSKLLPAAPESDMGGYAGLAGLAGISLPDKPRSMEAYYEYLLESQSFLAPLLEEKWKTRKFGEGVTLAEIYKQKLDLTKPNSKELYQHQMRHLFQDQKIISFTREKSTGVMTLSITTPDPVLSFELNRYLVRKMEEYNKTVKKTMLSEKNLFIEGRLKEVSEVLRISEEALRAFQEQNLNVLVPRARMMQERLAREMSVTNALYLELRKQYELGKIEEVKSTPVVEVLDAAVVPVYQIAPKKRTMVMLGTTFGFFLATFLAYVLFWWKAHGRQFFREIKAR